MAEHVAQWEDVRAPYLGGGIVIGNGASMAFDPRFRYSSLYREAVENRHINGEVERVFTQFETEDFELVLRQLGTARRVLEALGHEAQAGLTAAYTSVKQALISTVRATHPRHADVAERLLLAADFMKQFRTVACLNYDLVVYWALLESMDQGGAHRFKDCFVQGTLREDWTELRKPYGRYTKTTIVCYPHGHLALVRNTDGAERKLRRALMDLLGEIEDQWSAGECTPLFVSEGTAQEKKRAIEGSAYLNVVFREMLPTVAEHECTADAPIERTIVILGWSVGDQDTHILDALDLENVARVAIGIAPDLEFLEERQRQLRSLLRRHKLSSSAVVEWFDYASPGCWINAPANAQVFLGATVETGAFAV